jgi:S1-C subfamily serine protease
MPYEYYRIQAGARTNRGSTVESVRLLIPRSAAAKPLTQVTIQLLDLDEFISRVKDSGGNVIEEKMAIPGIGWHAICAEPGGLKSAMIQPLGTVESRASEPSIDRLGLGLQELTADQRDQLNVKGGLLVCNALGPAYRAGIRRGDVILAVNDVEVASVQEFNKVVSGLRSGQSLALLVLRDGAILCVLLPVPD